MIRKIPLLQAVLAVLILIAASAVAAPAQAGPIGDAKAAGLIGERPDGYLGAVAASVPGGVIDLMKKVNRERRSHYDSIAGQNGTSRQAVEAIMGQRLVEQAPAGTYVMDGTGRWRKK